MRADRLLSILLLLQTRRRMTAGALAARLEVSERTIHRDMEALSAAGVPVYAERGVGGGWVLPDDFRTKLPGLTEAEIRALFLTRPARLLADLGLQTASEAGLIKLLAALPSAHRLDAEYARQRIYLDGMSWHGAEETVPHLPALQEAVWQDRKVHLTYRRSDGSTVERLVSPLGLVAKRNTWYLVAIAEDDVRTYRVSRVLAITPTEDTFLRPPDFDLVACWRQSSAEFLANLPRYPATVRVAPGALDRARQAGWFVRVEAEESPDKDGRVTMALRFEVEEEACRFILSFGPEMEVLEPADLRGRVMRLAAETAALYGVGPGGRKLPKG